ncbi:ABC transporter permease [bacterium]|nr:ABC transporter permease [bacterium]
MAIRDSRQHRGKLLLFTLSIIMGVGAMVAIGSMNDNFKRDVDDQAKSLLGADLVLSSRQPFKPETETLIDSIGGEQSREISFASMIVFVKNGGTRLIQVKTIEGNFPYYGALETEPIESEKKFRVSQQALVDDGLMIQYGAVLGDSIKLGAMTFQIAGRIKKIPGESAATSLVSPPVYIPMKYLNETNLLQRGSRVLYKIYFKINDSEKIVESIKPHIQKYQLSYETVESRKAALGRSFDNLYRFLNLVAFIALLLGCVGVASSIHVFIKQKWSTIAVLRSMGAKSSQAFLIYLIQIAAMGFWGSLTGVLLGIGIQTILPNVFKDFLPVEVNWSLSWVAIGEGFAIGFLMAMLFALLPLLSVRKISPLVTLRSSYEEKKSGFREPLLWIVMTVITAAVCGFAGAITGDWVQGVFFTIAIALAFGLIILAARLLMRVVKQFLPRAWGYEWRQGLANLYRPNNQTIILMLSIGLGTFLISSLYLTQQMLVDQLSIAGSGTQPNVVLFDIQTDQAEGVAETVQSLGLPIMQRVPIVTMGLAGVKNKTIEEIRADTTSRVPRWVREFRCTYRDTLTNTETIIHGQLQKAVRLPSDTIFISIEESMAENLDVAIGDTVVFNVQGLTVNTLVGNIRKVDWRRVQPNFFVVFPTGVLEGAPQFSVLVTRVTSNEESAQLQQIVVQKFPNISIVDLTLILKTVDSLLSKISFVIRFMAFFSMLTGFIVLISALITSRYQRLNESVLLRTLGAVRRQVLRIMGIEYLFLGGLAALTGSILALGGAWALAYFVFETPYDPAWLPVVSVWLVVTAMTIMIGIFVSRDVLEKPPLEVLRSEV